MTDFKALAHARGLEIPEDELDRLAGTLSALEAAFRPLTAGLPSSLEPATVICPAEEAPEQ
jgi:hypothetical protein